MRGLVWVTVVLATLWGGWWVVGSRGAKAAAEGWFDQQAAQGLVAGYDDLAVNGFPSRFDLTVTAPHLSDPATGNAWRAPFAQVFAMSWKPWHLIAALPGGQVFTFGDQEVTLDAGRLIGSLLLVPGIDMALNEAIIEGIDLTLAPSVGGLRSVKSLIASIRADEGWAAEHPGTAYRMGLRASGLAVDPEPGADLADLRLDAMILMSAPLDRHAGQSLPTPRALRLTDARLTQGDLRLRATGELTADAAGFAAGQIEIKVENWRLGMTLLRQTGLVAPGFAPVLERGFEVMAAEGDDPRVLILPLVAKAGRMSLGPLPLGSAPYWGD